MRFTGRGTPERMAALLSGAVDVWRMAITRHERRAKENGLSPWRTRPITLGKPARVTIRARTWRARSVL